MSTSHEPLLLISGAGLPEWIWHDTRRALSDEHDTRVAARPASATTARLRDYAEAALRSAPAGRFAIVAHSSGGVIGAEVARLAPDRVSAFLAVTAVIPKPGGSFISAMPLPNRWLLGVAMRLAGTRPPDAAIRRGIADGLDEPTTARIIADFAPESPGLYRDATARAAARTALDGPRGYVVTSRDRELPPQLQRTFARRLDAAWTDELGTGHLPMLEDATALARSITRFLASIDTLTTRA
ncbi:alpha/beta hydrolase [Agromyces sp. H66]|uniref:alpha/beta fold hydrolase n=1 Tax=Agromyces sp. H66 TaxID=2529859 RepID=UPI0010AA5020|nr:alpha/beta hydrolase [Agromyces sp. H66]